MSADQELCEAAAAVLEDVEECAVRSYGGWAGWYGNQPGDVERILRLRQELGMPVPDELQGGRCDGVGCDELLGRRPHMRLYGAAYRLDPPYVLRICRACAGWQWNPKVIAARADWPTEAPA